MKPKTKKYQQLGFFHDLVGRIQIFFELIVVLFFVNQANFIDTFFQIICIYNICVIPSSRVKKERFP